MVWHRLPYNNFHDMNEDYICSRLEALDDSVDKAKESELSAKEYADASQLSAEASESSALASQLSASESLNSSKIFGSVQTELTQLASRMDEFSQLTEGSTTGDAELVDGRITYQGRTMANIGDAIRLQASQIYKYNSYNIFDNLNKTNRTTDGVTFTWNSDGSCTVKGTNTSAVICNIWSYQGGLPVGIEAGKTYYIKYSSETVNLRFSNYSSGTGRTFLETKTDAIVTIPKTCTALHIQLHAPAGEHNEVVTPILLNAETNVNITNMVNNLVNSINLDSQTSVFTLSNIYFEKGESSIYLQFDNLFFRSRFHRHFTPSTLPEKIDLVTSPLGKENCVEIPFGKTLIYHIDSDEFEIVNENTSNLSQSYSGLNTINLAYVDTSGIFRNGKLFDIYIQQNENINDIPSYFINQLNERIPMITDNIANAGRKGFTFIHITDTHDRLGSGKSPSLINYLMKNTRIPRMVHNGDIIGNYTDSQDTAKEELRNAVSKYNTDGKDKFFNIGNHDLNWVHNNTANPEAIITESDVYACVMADMVNVRYYQPDKYHYVYIDENSSTALIGLQTKFNYSTGAFPQEDVQPLTDLLDSLEVENIIITVHMLFSQDSSTRQYTNLNNNNYIRIRSAINNSNNASKVKAIVTGHNHLDYAVVDDGLLIVSTTTDSLIGHTADEGTVDECAFDVMTFNYDTNTLDCIRIGKGSNRQLTF